MPKPWFLWVAFTDDQHATQKNALAGKRPGWLECTLANFGETHRKASLADRMRGAASRAEAASETTPIFNYSTMQKASVELYIIVATTARCTQQMGCCTSLWLTCLACSPCHTPEELLNDSGGRCHLAFLAALSTPLKSLSMTVEEDTARR